MTASNNVPDQTEPFTTMDLVFMAPAFLYIVFCPIASIYFAVYFTFSAEPLTVEFIYGNYNQFRCAAGIVCTGISMIVGTRIVIWLRGSTTHFDIVLCAVFLLEVLACLPAAVLLGMGYMGELPFQPGCDLRMRDITLFVADNLAYGLASTLMQTLDLSFTQCPQRSSPFIAATAYTIRTVAWLGIAWLGLIFIRAMGRAYRRTRATAKAAVPLERDLGIPALP